MIVFGEAAAALWSSLSPEWKQAFTKDESRRKVGATLLGMKIKEDHDYKLIVCRLIMLGKAQHQTRSFVPLNK